WGGQQLGLALGQPSPRRRALALRAMPIAAAIIDDDFVGAVFAARDMPAEGRRAAALDRRHCLQLAEAHVAGVGLAPRRSVVAEDIRDLQNRTPHDRRGLCGRLVTSGLQRGQTIQRAHDVPDGVGGDARVERGRIELRVPQKNLDYTDIDVLLKHVRCKAVPQGMRETRLAISAIWAAAWQARWS